MKSKRKQNYDSDDNYNEEDDEMLDIGPVKGKKQLKKARSPPKKKVNPVVMKSNSVLDQNEDRIWALQHAGLGPAAIAVTLCKDLKLKNNAIETRQVSNWIYSHKKSGQGTTYKVSLQNNNLRANDSDCKL
jgi:hypothetical protein